MKNIKTTLKYERSTLKETLRLFKTLLNIWRYRAHNVPGEEKGDETEGESLPRDWRSGTVTWGFYMCFLRVLYLIFFHPDKGIFGIKDLSLAHPTFALPLKVA